MKECFVVLGNQLFDKKYLTEFKNSCDFFIQEDMGLCSYFKHHKQKILLFLSAMRSFRDELEKNGFEVIKKVKDYYYLYVLFSQIDFGLVSTVLGIEEPSAP